MSSNTESWGSRLGLVLAMAGNAVGFGNFLRFPVQAIQNGGGAFIVPYLVCFLLLGLPLLFVEWSMGRFGGQYGDHSTPFIFDRMGKKAVWKYIGVSGIFINIGVAAYYCYLESWTLGYLWYSVTGAFSGQTADGVNGMFTNYVGLSGNIPLVCWVICLAINTWILSRGLEGGVEVAAKIGMPLLILFGIFLAIRALTITAGSDGAINDGLVGANFLWKPDFSTIWTAKVWLAAAGQIFFTLSVGWGMIHSYAAYIKPNDDIALNSLSAGWTNEFVEVVLGASIVIPISVGYLGIERVVELTQSGGLGLGFRTMPFLFQQWGPVLAMLAGVAWFGLLFFAGITSSLAMGTPWMSFLRDEFNWSRNKSALSFGAIVFLLGLPTVFFYNEGVFDEFDYWVGTVGLVLAGLLEIILFSWIFGIERGWKEINRGADIKLPIFFKYVLKYVTPIIIAFVFIGSLPDIYDNLVHKKLYAKIAATANPAELAALQTQMTYLNWSRLLLVGVFVGICYMVFLASKKRKEKEIIEMG
jgi:neurotransmitter:Na+ symporter, NSS family